MHRKTKTTAAGAWGRKALSLLLATIMIMSVVPAAAFAVSEGDPDEYVVAAENEDAFSGPASAEPGEGAGDETTDGDNATGEKTTDGDNAAGDAVNADAASGALPKEFQANFADIMAASSAVSVLDLSDDATTITAADPRFAVSNRTIIVSGSDPVAIQGDGTAGGWSIEIEEATDITIAAGTVIDASSGNALSVPDGAVVTGMGGDISITAGDIAFVSVQGTSSEPGSTAIYSAGSLTVAGEFGDINASRYGIYGGGTTVGPEVYNTVSITGEVGNITVKNEYQTTSSFSYGGVFVIRGGVIITGGVGDIESCGVGIYANYDVTISGRVGDITVTSIRGYSGIGASNGVVTINEDAVIGNVTSPIIGIDAPGFIISGTIGIVQGGIFCAVTSPIINSYITVISTGNTMSSMNYAFSRQPEIGLDRYTAKWSEDVSGVPFDGAVNSYPWSRNHKWVQISEPPVVVGGDAELLTSGVSLTLGSRKNVFAVFYDNFGALEGTWDNADLVYSVKDALGSEVKTGTAQRNEVLGSTQIMLDFDATTPAIPSEYTGGEYLPAYTITLTADNGAETVSATANVYLLPPPVVIETLTDTSFVFLGEDAVFEYAVSNLLPGYSLSSDKGEVHITNEETVNGLISLTARVTFRPEAEGAHYITFTADSAYGQDSRSVTQRVSAGDSSLAALSIAYKDSYDGSPAEFDYDDNGNLILYGLRESTIAQLFSAYGADNQKEVYEALGRMWQSQTLNVVAPASWGGMTINGAGVASARLFDSTVCGMPQTLAWANVDSTLTFIYKSGDLSRKLRAYKLENGIDAPVNVSYTNGKSVAVSRTIIPYNGFIFLYDADGFAGQIRMYQNGADSFRYCVEQRAGLTRTGHALAVSPVGTWNPLVGGKTPFAYTSVYMLNNPSATFRPLDMYDMDGSDTFTVRYGVIDANGSFIAGTGGEISSMRWNSSSFSVPYGAMYENPDSRLMVEYDFGRGGNNAKHVKFYDLKTLDRAFKNRSAVSYEYQRYYAAGIKMTDPRSAVIFDTNGGSRDVSLGANSGFNSFVYLRSGETFEIEFSTGGREIESASVSLEQWKKRTDTGKFDFEHDGTTAGKVYVEHIGYGFTPNNYARLRFDLNETLKQGNHAEMYVKVVFTDGTGFIAMPTMVQSDDGGVTFATEQKVLEILEGYKFFNPDEMYMNLGELNIAADMDKFNNQGLWEQGKPWCYVEPEVAAVYGNIKVPYAIPSANPFTWDVTREGDEYIVRGYVDAVKMNDGSWRHDFGSGAYEQVKQETLDAIFFGRSIYRNGDFIHDEWPGMKGYLEGKAVVSPAGDVSIVFNDSYVLVDSAFQYVPKNLWFDLDYYYKWTFAHITGTVQTLLELAPLADSGSSQPPINYAWLESSYLREYIDHGWDDFVTNAKNIELGLVAFKVKLEGYVAGLAKQNAYYHISGESAGLDRSIPKYLSLEIFGNLCSYSSMRIVIVSEGEVISDKNEKKIVDTRAFGWGNAYSINGSRDPYENKNSRTNPAGTSAAPAFFATPMSFAPASYAAYGADYADAFNPALYYKNGTVRLAAGVDAIPADAFGLDAAQSGNGSTVAAWGAYNNKFDASRINAGDLNGSATYAAGMAEITAGMYDGSNWTVKTLTDNGRADLSPKTAANGNKGVVVWRQGDVEVGGLESDRPTVSISDSRLMFALYNGASWGTPAALYSVSSNAAVADYTVAMADDGSALATILLENGKIVTVKIGANGTVTTVNNNLPASARIDLIYNGETYTLSRADSNGFGLVLHELNIAGFVTGTVFENVPAAGAGEFKLVRDFAKTGLEAAVLVRHGSEVKTEDDPATEDTDETEIANVFFASRMFASGGSVIVAAPVTAAAENGGAAVDSFDAYVSGQAVKILAIYEAYNDGEEAGAYYFETQAQFKHSIAVSSGSLALANLMPGRWADLDISVTNKGFAEITNITVKINGGDEASQAVSVLPNGKINVTAPFTPGQTLPDSVGYTVTAAFADGSSASASGVINLKHADVAVEIVSSEKTDDARKLGVAVSNQSPFSLNGKTVVLGLYADASGLVKAADEVVIDGSRFALSVGDLYGASVSAEFTLADAENLPAMLYLIAKVYDADGGEVYDINGINNYRAFSTFTLSRDMSGMRSVTFVDWDGTVLNTQLVQSGEAAIPPEAPVREGYSFLGWDTDFESVTSDLTVTALYRANLKDVTPSAYVEKLNGNKNNLTIIITERYADGTENEIMMTFSINNNAADTYAVGDYKVYVDTKGNTQIRACYIVE